jgi:hypothetical protein
MMVNGFTGGPNEPTAKSLLTLAQLHDESKVWCELCQDLFLECATLQAKVGELQMRLTEIEIISRWVNVLVGLVKLALRVPRTFVVVCVPMPGFRANLLKQLTLLWLRIPRPARDACKPVLWPIRKVVQHALQ